MIWILLFALIVITLIVIAILFLYRAGQYFRNRKQDKLKEKWAIFLESNIDNENNAIQVIALEVFEKLQSIEELMAFYAAAVDYIDSDTLERRESFRAFIRHNKRGWIKLGENYRHRKSIEQAYFAYICEKFRVNNPDEHDELTELMLSIALEPSINSRENAVKALNAFGNQEAIVAVFKSLSHENHLHHRKLVTDGLLAFKGDQGALAQALYHHFNEFDATYQVAMIDFFRLSNAPLTEKLIELLEKGNKDKEVLCAVLRYYEKYPVQDYKETILSYLTQTFDENWECVSTAAAVLGQYPGEDTIQALKVALSSKYWYVRLNAARSIATLGVAKELVMDILDGQDLYAKEQLIYQMENVRERQVQNG